MSQSLPASHRQTWSHLCSWLLIGFICYALPWSVFAAAPATGAATENVVLRIQGSNTIGARLGPALVKGMLEAQGLSNVQVQPGAENEQWISGHDRQGQSVWIQVAAHGSGTGFTALQDGSADLAASSRPIKAGEVANLAGLGDMRSAAAEQVIAIDGLAIILNPANPLDTLSTEQLARIFSGEIRTWEEIGGSGGAINLYARDDKSGTYDTFKELVLAAHGKSLAAGAKRFESSDRLSDEVSQDPRGIGFIGLPYVRKSKAVAIADGPAKAKMPSTALIATEDYPLSRRLFFYNPPTSANPWLQALVRFAHGAAGQAIVEQNGFVAQTVRAIAVQPTADMPNNYQQLATHAKRLSVNFRFQEASATLDNKAQRDIERVVDYLKSQNKLHNQVVLVGFGDIKSRPERAELLSRLRAMAVRRELAERGGVVFRDVVGFGEALPVAANDADDGRVKNRRVEVWVY
jgi:phosphate transport system substrate-binding protein